MDPYGGTDPLGMLLHFLKRDSGVLALLLSVMFQQLVRLGSFPACWRQANNTQIPKGPPSSSVANYRPISITSILSKVFEHLMSVFERLIYVTQWCASYHLVCLSERSGNL